jgi:excisionase family DNA binding protein
MKYYTLDEVAKLLRVSPKTIYGMIDSGRLKAVRLNRMYRIPESALDALLVS